ncbi:MAG TPA: GNAT family N-acetyltransferase [Terriglobales bacterium]|nr:GNAT family N-acetyltransferase [Terriglobales bacterium]
MLIRPASPHDAAAIYSLLCESAHEQGGEESLCASEQNLVQDGFGPQPAFWVLVAEEEGRAIGLALYFFIYSTWTSRKGLYLEDLYVRPEFRRRGVARRLMRALAQAAKQNGCGRMIWLVLRSNPAVGFYQGLGAEALEHWMPMQMKQQEIDSLTD